MARAAPVGRGGGDDERAATFGERLAVLIEVGSGDLPGTAGHHIVGAVDAAAAPVVGDEKVPPGIVLHDERGFDGTADGLLAGTAAERVQGGVLIRGLTGIGVEAAHLDATPEAAPVQPDAILVFHHQVGVDGVPIVLVLERAEHHAFVGPEVLGVGGIERGVGGEPDGGVAAAEGGEGVVEVVFAFVIGDVGGPGAARAGNFLLAPLRHAGERGAGVGPVDEVLGSADGDDAAGSAGPAAPTAGAEDVVRVLLFDDDG